MLPPPLPPPGKRKTFFFLNKYTHVSKFSSIFAEPPNKPKNKFLFVEEEDADDIGHYNSDDDYVEDIFKLERVSSFILFVKILIENNLLIKETKTRVTLKIYRKIKKKLESINFRSSFKKQI